LHLKSLRRSIDANEQPYLTTTFKTTIGRKKI